MIDLHHSTITVGRQCQLMGLARSSLYYRPMGPSEEDLALMRLIDEQYTTTPFYGSRRMAATLRALGHPVGRRRIGRLMRLMGLAAIYPKPRLSQPGKAAERYPYLLRGVAITRPDQVWSADITYIRLRHGFIYLVAVIDWFSRRVLAWQVSLTLEADFCLEALEEALASHGAPEIFNSDQGSQFTSEAFTERLKEAGVRISRDGKGRALDNIFVERLWRSVKYEEVYLKDYAGVGQAVRSLGLYFDFYNHRRVHQALDYRTPVAVHAERRTSTLTLIG
jgi:putative transposase